MLTAQGSFSTGVGAVASTVVVSGLAFQPKAVIVWWSGEPNTSDTAGSGHAQPGFGFFTSPTSRACVYGRDEDAVASSDTGRGATAAAAVSVFVSATDTVDGALDVQSMDSGGFTLVVDDQFAASYRIHYLALGGDDITDVYIGSANEPAATGNQAISAVGFQPDFLLIASAWTSSAASGTLALSLGAASGASNQAVWSAGHDDAQTTAAPYSYSRGGEILARIVSGATLSRASLASFDASGFTLNWSERNSTPPYYYLTLKGGSYHVNELLSQTNTSNFSTTDPGFEPAAIMLVSANKAEDAADTPTQSIGLSLGAATGSAQALHAWSDEYGTADTEVARAVDHDSIYLRFATDDSVTGQSALVSMDASGFTLAHSNADPDQAFMWYVAFGPAEGGGGGNPWYAYAQQ